VSEPDERRTWAALIGLGLLFALVAGGLQLDRLARLEPRSFDLAIYAQIVWNAGHGSAWSSIQQAPSLGVHLSPWLLALGPLTWVFPAAPLLVAVQALALGALAPLLYLILRAHDRRRAAWAAGLSLLYPPLWSLALADFHPLTLGCPLALALVWALESRRRRTAVALAVALGTLVHEVYPLVLLGLGPALWLRGRRREGVGLAVMGLVWFALGTAWVLPALRGDALAIEQVYGHLGDGPLWVVLSPVLRPSAFFGHVLSLGHAVWLLGLLLPLGVLGILRPTWLLPALPVLALHALSARATQQSLAFHYHGPAVPWLLLAAGWAWCQAPCDCPPAWRATRWQLELERRHGRWLAATAPLGLALALGLGQLESLQARGLSPEPLLAVSDAARVDDPLATACQEAVASVPADAPALGSVDLLAALADRGAVWGMPGVVRGFKDWSEVPYAPPPTDTWVLANTAEGARSFWADLPRPHPTLAEAAGRWREVALARGVVGLVEGVVLLAPEGALPLFEALPPAEPVAEPALLGCVPGEVSVLSGTRAYRLEVSLPEGWTRPLRLLATYRDASGAVLRRSHWPVLYRLYDAGPHPQRARVQVGLLELGTRVELSLLPLGAQPIPGLDVELE
jgi:uncharacterized membrane protein